MKDNRIFQVHTPAELKALNLGELKELADSLRSDIIQHTSVNGGHIGASLCCVDFIVALHKVFETPRDSFVFDVGHQAYAHKMLTGRRFQFYKVRKENGPAGFTNRAESEHDAFGAGHASTSISAALGILEGKSLKGDDDARVVAVIGDGALTGGLSFEGLNHAGDLKRNLIVILNDNKISIDPNVGALKDSFNADAANARNFFTQLGLDYWGPFNGHDLEALIETFGKAKNADRPLVIHLMTEKGRSYAPAVKDKVRFHGCGPFDVETGTAIASPDAKPKYQDIFAETLIELASNDPHVVAITAAMPSGTSLKKFQKVLPERFYDVGIAEGHAALFGAGLATQGMKPFVSIYSTFLQRGYDQLIHDIALQNLPVRVCMDRGGLVGDDGATHQGVFDYAYLRCVPNFVVMAPKDEAELQNMLETMRLYDRGPISVRFPRGEVRGVSLDKEFLPIPIGQAEHLYGGSRGDVLILAIGEPVYDAVEAAKNLVEHHGLTASVVNLRFAKPLDELMIVKLAPHFRAILTVEEGARMGGVGSAILEILSANLILKPVEILGVPDRFVEHASQKRQRQMCGIDPEGIASAVLDVLRRAERAATQGSVVTPLRARG